MRCEITLYVSTTGSEDVAARACVKATCDHLRARCDEPCTAFGLGDSEVRGVPEDHVPAIPCLLKDQHETVSTFTISRVSFPSTCLQTSAILSLGDAYP